MSNRLPLTEQNYFFLHKDAIEQFIAGVVDTADKQSFASLSPVSLTPLININSRLSLPNLMSNRLPLIEQHYFFLHKDATEQFIAGVVDTADKHSFAIISAKSHVKQTTFN
jgi:hypothetical protein